jgi:hypothetical protein
MLIYRAGIIPFHSGIPPHPREKPFISEYMTLFSFETEGNVDNKWDGVFRVKFGKNLMEKLKTFDEYELNLKCR